MDTPEMKAKAIAKLRAAMTPVRKAYTHTARQDALRHVQGMLFMLCTIELVDRDTLEALNNEILNAESEGSSRCDEKLASGEESRCMDDTAIPHRAVELMALHELVEEVRQALDLAGLEQKNRDFEDRLMKAWPAFVDDVELLEWRVDVMTAKNEKLKSL
ncbi:hypothetical protein CFN16_18290 [Pseudomonas fluorescens]|uniref:Uncharacterized protein n=1 Tax=Pseudomonas fluorescens TaxID=294 RepID=A0A345UZU8_PSEFL|nr:hypothetical protein [Pseudomonas fluorescens]AXJ06000.1 hypothetical protein CFN16_18290 [Pseudomonas fluorescens]